MKIAILQCSCSRFVALLAVLFTLAFGDRVLAQSQKKNLLRVKGADGKEMMLYRKVIIRSDNAILLKEPGGAPIGEVEPFAIYHLLKVKPDGDEDLKNDHYHVGTSDGAHRGWIHKDHVIAWNSRFVLDPQFEPGRVFKAYTTKEKTGESELVAPITGHKRVAAILETVDAGKTPIYKIAFYAGKTSTDTDSPISKASNAPSIQPIKPEEVLRKLKLEVVYVIDSTGSMTPLIKGTKDVIRQSAEELAKRPELQGAIRFGLVTYQDSTSGLIPSRMVSKLTTDMKAFTAAVESVQAATISSEETQEDVLAGMKMGIEESGWDETSLKHIILLGDASALLTGPKNSTGLDIQRIIDRARPQARAETAKELNVKNLHAVRALNPVDPEDGKRCDAQFKEIAGNNTEYKGMYLELDPNRDADIKRVVAAITNELNNTYELVAAGRKGTTLTPPTNAPANGSISTSYWRLHATLMTGNRPVSPVLTAFACDKDSEGRELALQKVILYKKDVVRLHSSLDSLYTQLKEIKDPAERANIDSVLDALKIALASRVAGQSIGLDTNLEALISELPLSTDVLRTTPKQIATLNQAGFEIFLGKIKSAADRTQQILNDQWNVVKIPGSSGNNDAEKEEFNYLHISQLP